MDASPGDIEVIMFSGDEPAQPQPGAPKKIFGGKPAREVRE
jgi:hypothetical protein